MFSLQTIEPQSVVIFDAEGILTFVSSDICELLGSKRRALIGKSIEELVASESHTVLQKYLLPSLIKGEPLADLYLRLLAKDGQGIPMLAHFERRARAKGLRLVCFCDPVLRRSTISQELARMQEELRRSEIERSDLFQKFSAAYEALAAETAEWTRLQGELTHLAFTDKLTNLPNRRSFDNRLDEAYLHFLESGIPFSILMVDIDQFKAVNDTYGHDGGDFVLQGVASLLNMTVRRLDFVTRWGGEEFAVLLPESAGHAATATAERIRTTIESARFRRKNVTVSIGVVTCTSSESTCAKLMLSADLALYSAKQGGRNRVVHAAMMESDLDRRKATMAADV